MPINRANVRKLLQGFDFKTLFIEEMGWGNVPNSRPAPIEYKIKGVDHERNNYSVLR